MLVIFHQTEEFNLHAIMGFGNFIGSFEYISLGHMKACHIRGSGSVFVEIHAQHDFSACENDVSLFNEFGRFRLHKSKPSRRISYINGVRSR